MTGIQENSVVGAAAQTRPPDLAVTNHFRDSHDEMHVDTCGLSASFHGTIDWDVAKRMLRVLYHDGPVGRTILAMRSGLNYGAGTRYLSWMREVGWIRVGGNKKAVEITDLGADACERLAL